MTGTAIVMMLVAILVVWGGLAVAVTYLVRHPLDDDADGPVEPGPSQPRTSESR